MPDNKKEGNFGFPALMENGYASLALAMQTSTSPAEQPTLNVILNEVREMRKQLNEILRRI